MADTSHFDNNHVPGLMGVSNADGSSPVTIYADPITHRLLIDSAGSAGTGTYYDVTGSIDGNNVTFAIAITVTSDFLLFLNRQPQMLTTDFTYVAGVGTTTITYVTAPDASYSGLPHVAYVVS